MNLENSIKDVIGKKLEDGSIEKLIEEQLEKGVLNALDNIFRSYGDVTKVIEDKIKSVMIPYIEKYDYSQYITKLDSVLVDVLKNSALDNKKMLENFKELMTVEECEKTIKVSDLFNKWKKYVSKNVKTEGLEVDCYDGEPSYENVDVSLDVEYEDDRSWSSYQYATLIFGCEHDEEMNFAIRLSRWKKDKESIWNFNYDTKHDLKSLRHLNKFEVFLMRLDQNYTKVELDTDYENDEVEVEQEPEVDWR